HVAVPRRGSSDRHRGDREHDRSRRARSRTRFRGDAAPQSGAARGSSLHLGGGQRLRQRQLSGRAGASGGGCRIRPAAARAGGGGASRGMPIGGSATLLAARALGERIRTIAAALLETHAPDIELGGGRAAVRGSPERGLSYAELARAAHFRSNELRGVEPSLEATVHYTNPGAWTFTNGAHLAVVEVDTDTGRVRILRYVAVDDCGRIINPALVEGQIAGGVAQGLGGALMEHCVYDDTGQLLSTTLMDYAVPTGADLPPIEMYHLESPAPGLAGG